MSYLEKLRDPRWQKVRLQILERAQWKCECCENDKLTLHIHHLVYSHGEPWEAPPETLEALCEECHQWREDKNRLFEGRSLLPTRKAMLVFGIITEAFTDLPDLPTKTKTNPLEILALCWQQRREWIKEQSQK